MIKKISIVVSEEEEKRFKELAAKDGRSLSAFLKRAIERGLTLKDSSQEAHKQAA